MLLLALCDTRINDISVVVTSTNWSPFLTALTERLKRMDLGTKLPFGDLK